MSPAALLGEDNAAWPAPSSLFARLAEISCGVYRLASRIQPFWLARGTSEFRVNYVGCRLPGLLQGWPCRGALNVPEAWTSINNYESEYATTRFGCWDLRRSTGIYFCSLTPYRASTDKIAEMKFRQLGRNDGRNNLLWMLVESLDRQQQQWQTQDEL